MSVAVNSGVAWNGLSKRLAIETSALDVGGRLRAEPALLKFHATSSDKSVMASRLFTFWVYYGNGRNYVLYAARNESHARGLAESDGYDVTRIVKDES